MAGNHNEIEKRPWNAADELRANSKLKSSEYSAPVLGLIFLRYVGAGKRPADDFDFKKKLEEFNEELETLNAEARELEDRIAENVARILETNE